MIRWRRISALSRRRSSVLKLKLSSENKSIRDRIFRVPIGVTWRPLVDGRRVLEADSHSAKAYQIHRTNGTRISVINTQPGRLLTDNETGQRVLVVGVLKNVLKTSAMLQNFFGFPQKMAIYGHPFPRSHGARVQKPRQTVWQLDPDIAIKKSFLVMILIRWNPEEKL